MKKTEKEFETFDAITVDDQGKFIIAISSIGTLSRNDFAQDLIWLQVSRKDGKIYRVGRKAVVMQYTYRNQRRSLQFYGYINEFPVVYTCERFGKGVLNSYYFDGTKIREFMPKIDKFSIDENFRLYMKNGYMFMVDVSGRLVRYQTKKFTREQVNENLINMAKEATVQKIMPEVGGGVAPDLEEDNVAMTGNANVNDL